MSNFHETFWKRSEWGIWLHNSFVEKRNTRNFQLSIFCTLSKVTKPFWSPVEFADLNLRSAIFDPCFAWAVPMFRIFKAYASAYRKHVCLHICCNFFGHCQCFGLRLKLWYSNRNKNVVFTSSDCKLSNTISHRYRRLCWSALSKRSNLYRRREQLHL